MQTCWRTERNTPCASLTLCGGGRCRAGPVAPGPERAQSLLRGSVVPRNLRLSDAPRTKALQACTTRLQAAISTSAHAHSLEDITQNQRRLRKKLDAARSERR